MGLARMAPCAMTFRVDACTASVNRYSSNSEPCRDDTCLAFKALRALIFGLVLVKTCVVTAQHPNDPCRLLLCGSCGLS
jgi:hypothetical protein